MTVYGPTGRDGRWPDAHAVTTFLHDRTRDDPTVRVVATHEAGHVLVAHHLGVPIASVTARIPREGGGHYGGDAARAPIISGAAGLRIAVGGRAADEAAGRYWPLRFGRAGDDETAITQARTLAAGDAARTAHHLVTALAEARAIVADHGSALQRVADALERGDLTGADLDRLLGPRPRGVPAAVVITRPVTPRRDVIYRAAGRLLRTLPYGLALVPALDGGGVLWIDARGALHLTPQPPP